MQLGLEVTKYSGFQVNLHPSVDGERPERQGKAHALYYTENVYIWSWLGVLGFLRLISSDC